MLVCAPHVRRIFRIGTARQQHKHLLATRHVNHRLIISFFVKSIMHLYLIDGAVLP